MNKLTKQLALATAMMAGATGVAFAGGDSSMNPFTGDSYAFFEGHNIGPEQQMMVGVPIGNTTSAQATTTAPTLKQDVARMETAATRAEQSMRTHLAHVQTTPPESFNDNTGA